MLSESKFVEITEDEYTALRPHTSSPLKQFIQIVLRRVWIVVLAAVLLTGATVAFSFMQTPMYEASTLILVGQRGTDEIPEDVFDLQQLTQTMTEAVHSRPVAEEVIRRLDLRETPEDLLQNMSAEQINATQFIQVNYTDPDPQRAVRVANTIGEVFPEQISEVSPSASSITVTVWENATVPDEPVSPSPVRNGAIALATGVMLGVALVLLLDYLDEG